MSTIKKIIKYLDKNNFDVYEHYEVDDDSTKHIFFLDNTILHFDENKKTLDVSFNVEVQPDISANDILILSGIPGIIDLKVMESYVITEDKGILSGDEAFKRLEDTRSKKIFEQFIESHQQVQFLLTEEGYNC